MSGTDIVYNPQLALQNLADRLAQAEHDNAILRASLAYYQELAERPSENTPVTLHTELSTGVSP